MGLKNDRPFISLKRLKKSFYYAFSGLRHTWKKEQNFRIHLVVAFVILVLAQVLKVSLVEQALLVIVIGCVLALELINTAIENIVDKIVQTYDVQAKIIKDAAAGAVLIFSITAIIVGAVILIPRLISFIF